MTGYKQNYFYKQKKSFPKQNYKYNRHQPNGNNALARKKEAANTSRSQEDSKGPSQNKSLELAVSNKNDNSTKISFLCDSGADETILSENGCRKIATKFEGLPLKKYFGPKLNSASGKLEI